jgi:hypothetical protein
MRLPLTNENMMADGPSLALSSTSTSVSVLVALGARAAATLFHHSSCS